MPKTSRELLLLKQKGKCARCGRTFASMRAKPIVHHTGKSNQIRSMQLLCPNCHSNGAHSIRKRSDIWGNVETVVKRKKFGKKKAVKKKKTRKRKKNSDEWSLW